MLHRVKTFLITEVDLSKPILLGISGGPDSLVLLHLIVECRRFFPINIGIAHINHRWREESGGEALLLQKQAQNLGIPFHLKELNPEEFQGNIEAYCRRKRIDFFTDLCDRHGYQGVMLAHHGDDLAETVLKRVFEGADLANLVGMQPLTTIGHLKIWRPLLSVSKKEILGEVKRLSLEPFNDKTNLDPRFLRGRFRTEIIPELSTAFGKNISGPLQKLSVEAAELKNYLDERTKLVIAAVEKGPLGICLDLQPFPALHLVEAKHVVKHVCKSGDFLLSNEHLQKAAAFLSNGAANKSFESGGKVLYIDRGRLFIPQKPLLAEAWNPVSRKTRYVEEPFKTGWKPVWSGEVDVFLPLDDYTISTASPSTPYLKNKSLDDLWTDSKVPAFLRQAVPVVWHKGVVVHEFLTGKVARKLSYNHDALHIVLRFGD